MSKYIDLIAWEDCPHLQEPHITKEELDELEADLLPHQRQARKTGMPSLGAGAIYPIQLDDVLIDPFPIPVHWEKAYALDVGWNRTAALWGTADIDAQEPIYYLVDEYYVAQAEPVVHAHSIRSRGDWLTGAIDPAARQSSQKDGIKLRQEYEDLDLNLITAVNAREAGFLHVLKLFNAGRLKVFRNLGNWQKEFRLYRRDEKGRVVKENDHLMDCMRYLLMTSGIFSTKPRQEALSKKRSGEW